ncbi:hypothetical protein AB1Y20_000069 [Prymnesium parvum]|uniref:Tetratricopeptide repeat protein n=1 Tax=Prymnesium parvum TaxID=97485 RepID=A0AB34K3W1_PRYPA
MATLLLPAIAALVGPPLPRRALFASPAALLFAAPPPAHARSAVRQAMATFAEGRVEEALELYDAILAANPAARPYLWQRGLALYYAGRFDEGAAQFADDVAVNPNDTEEQIWHLLCLAQVKGGLASARAYRLSVGEDRRPVMRAVQRLFLSGDEADEREVELLAREGEPGTRFYAALYLSLYRESLGDKEGARKRMLEAVATEYARGTGRLDPMVELANVAVRRRGWE